MMPTLAFLSTSVLVGQTAGAGNTVATVLGVLGATVAAALIVVVVRLQATRKALKSLSVEHQSTTEAHRALMDKERKLAKELEQRREELKDLKQTLGSQKKKGHSTQEESKGLRAEIKRLTEELELARKERPAFSERPATTKPPVEAKPAAEPRPVAEVKPQPTEVAPKAESVSSTPADAETRDRLDRLEADNRALAEALRTERDERDRGRDELQQLRRRVEGLRRVDIITKGKVELLEDKVRSLGRQYYDAVSEVAVLKGEVAPPRPRDLAPPPSAVADDTAADDEADDVVATAATSLPVDVAARPEPSKENADA